MAKELSLKLLIDHKTHKILFAEASKDVVDFLFGLLSLPMGSIIKLLTKDGMVGCIGNIYKSLEQLDVAYLQSYGAKTTLLSPPVSKTTFLLPSSLSSTTKHLYACPNSFNNYSYNNSSCQQFTEVRGRQCPNCKSAMSKELRQMDADFTERLRKEGEGEGEGYVKGVVTYTVLDDLTIVPMSTISSITLLTKFQVMDLGSLEEKVVKLGLEEGLELLKASLQSKTVLSDVFLGKK